MIPGCFGNSGKFWKVMLSSAMYHTHCQVILCWQQHTASMPISHLRRVWLSIHTWVNQWHTHNICQHLQSFVSDTSHNLWCERQVLPSTPCSTPGYVFEISHMLSVIKIETFKALLRFRDLSRSRFWYEMYKVISYRLYHARDLGNVDGSSGVAMFDPCCCNKWSCESSACESIRQVMYFL